ncbi:MAG: hypothetical protein SFX72_12405 [Isosphaeraceae bacterium]|nr:hypothetical protein [Isosphaeraceae bacterium]
MSRLESRFVATAVSSLLLSWLAASPSLAGQARYDAKRRGFEMTYIYRDLPSNSISSSAVLQAPSRRRPTEEQKQQVELFLDRVSTSLMKLTAGRARIVDLQEVSDIQKADVVISLSGNVKPQAGGAWAMANGWRTPGMTLNLYYEDLLNDRADAVTATVVHELCHYLFGLPDEYPAHSSLSAVCPLRAGTGPRCIMDNFHVAGNIGFCTKDDHNPLAPGINGFPPVFPDKKHLSCDEIVDQFFAKFGVQKDAVSALPDPIVDADRIPAGLEEKALAVARAEVERLKRAKGGKTGFLTKESRSKIRGMIMNGLVDFLQGAGGKPPANFAGLAGKLATDFLLEAAGTTPGFSIIKPLLAKRLEELRAKNAGKLPSTLAVENDLAELAKKELVARARREGATPAPLSPEDLAFISSLVREATANSTLGSAELLAKTHARLDVQTAETLLALSNEFKLPGAVLRRRDLETARRELERLGAINVRPLSDRFGYRRTLIVIPPVLVPDSRAARNKMMDQTPTQGYLQEQLLANYNILRGESLSAFSKLMDRNQIAVSFAGSLQDGEVIGALGELQSQSARDILLRDLAEGLGRGATDPDGVANLRAIRLGRELKEIQAQLERNQLENIIVLVPPGGFPDEFRPALELLRGQFIGKSDLRLDIAIVGATRIPPELRDLVTRTQGSILTVSDLDEIAAVAQRLAGNSTQGSWIRLPDQGILKLAKVQASLDSKKGEAAPNAVKPSESPLESSAPIPPEKFLWGRLLGARRVMSPEIENQRVRIEMQPFYADGRSRYQLTLGFSQQITVPGVSSNQPIKTNAIIPGVVSAPKNAVPSRDPKTDYKNAIDPENRVARSQGTGSSREPSIELMPGLIPIEQRVGIERRVVAQSPDLRLRHDLSSPHTLVFDLPETITPGWYSPSVVLPTSCFQTVGGANRAYAEFTDPRTGVTEQAVAFTFSVGSLSTQAQLVVDLQQDLKQESSEDAEGTPVFRAAERDDHGRLGPDETKAVITAVLTVGRAVRNAEVFGYLQRIENGSEEPIKVENLVFSDNGEESDKVKGDGVYTAEIELGSLRKRSAEYRVFVEARSIEGKTVFVPAGDPVLAETLVARDAQRNGETPESAAKTARAIVTGADLPAPSFQRATSIQFQVAADAGN